MRRRVLMTNFSGGMVSKRVMGELDVPYQHKAVESLENFIVAPDGGITRRRGTIRLQEGLGITPHADGLFGTLAIPAFQVIRRGDGSTDDLWLVWPEAGVSTYRLRALNLRTLAEQTTDESASIVPGLHLARTATYYSLPDPAAANQKIRFWTPTGAVTLALSDWTLTDETAREIATIYQNRLIAMERSYGALYSSVPLDTENFDVTKQQAIPDTDPVEYETVNTGAFLLYPDFYGAEHPRWILARNGLFFGTDTGEYELTSSLSFLSHEPGGAVIEKMSEIGCEGAIAFGPYIVLRSRDQVLRSVWGQDTYQTENAVTLLDNGTVIEHVGVEYGGHRYLLFLDIHGDLYCRTEAPARNVGGWATIATGVWWIAEHHNDLYIVRDTSGTFVVEVLPLDSLFEPGNRSAHIDETFRVTNRYADGCGYLTVGSAAVTGDVLPASDTVAVYKLASGALSYVGERATTAGGVLSGTLAEIKTFVGYVSDDVHLFCYSTTGDFISRVKTLPLQVPVKEGSALGEIKQIYGIVVVVHESTALRARINDGPWESWNSATPFSGPVPLLLESSTDTEVQVEIESVGPAKLDVRAIEADVEVAEV